MSTLVDTTNYARYALLPLLKFSLPWVERPVLPMIDTTLSKQDALPPHFWGLMYDDWKPPAPGKGHSLFMTGLENRGPDNMRKRQYMAALTPDLYGAVYRSKVQAFWDHLFEPKNVGKPLLQLYFDRYVDLFFTLHFGGNDIVPLEVKRFGLAFNTVIAYADPRKRVVFKNYLVVRRHMSFVRAWVREQIAAVAAGVPGTEQSFAYFWLKNGISEADVEAEVFLNFIALSQWGTTLAGVAARLSGDRDILCEFAKAMKAGDDGVLSDVKYFVMELMRDISPNVGAFSRTKTKEPPGPDGYSLTPLRTTSYDPIHWSSPEIFDPGRYTRGHWSASETSAAGTGLRCPFERKYVAFAGRRASWMLNSVWGTVYPEGNPVFDFAGYAPFGFGYRRCPGELFSIEMFIDLLRKIWVGGITFHNLDGPSQHVPTGAFATADDNIVFHR